MSRIFLHGCGAVSPAGWGVSALRAALSDAVPLATQPLVRPGQAQPLAVRRVPAPNPRPAFLAHPRLRRTSSITHFAVGAAVEALGADAARVVTGEIRLGVIYCAFAGCVAYSRRFYDEVLRDPSTASPLIFPETVFNAPASHLSAFLGTTAVNYTLIGDQGEVIKALALAADWLLADRVDGCLVVAAEEADWLTADALRLFAPGVVAAEGAGAIYLRREPAAVELVSVSEPQLFLHARGRDEAAKCLARSLVMAGSEDDLLCDGLAGTAGDATEFAVWENWTGRRCSPKRVLGEGLGAAGGWQLVAAADAIGRGEASRAVINVIGTNEQAVAAVLRRA